MSKRTARSIDRKPRQFKDAEGEGIDVYAELVDAGVPLDNRIGDLFAKVTPVSTAIIKRHRFASNVEVFTSQIDGERWYEIPFAYTPFWDERTKRYQEKKS